VPAMAASTCSQAPARRATSAMPGSGSMAVVAVLPTVATTAQGRTPRATSPAIACSSASTRMAFASSDDTARTWARPNPARSAAFSTELCAWSEA